MPSNVGSGVGLIPVGPQNNPNIFTGFAQASNGFVVAAPVPPGQANPHNGTAAGDITARADQDIIQLGGITINSLARGGVFGPLFGAAINNTFGSGNPFIPPFDPGAYGFGSGANPNQPWMPAAYVNGLQNVAGTPNAIYGDHGILPLQPYRPYLSTSHRGADNASEPNDEPSQRLEVTTADDPLSAGERLEPKNASPRQSEQPPLQDAETEERSAPAELRTPQPAAREDVFSVPLSTASDEDASAGWEEWESALLGSKRSRNEDRVAPLNRTRDAIASADENSTLLSDLVFAAMPMESLGDFPVFLAAIFPEEWVA